MQRKEVGMQEVIIKGNKTGLKVYVNEIPNISQIPEEHMNLLTSFLLVEFTNNFKKRRQKKTKVEPPQQNITKIDKVDNCLKKWNMLEYKRGDKMMSLPKIRSDLIDIRYYYSRKEMFEKAFEETGANDIIAKVQIYNNAVKSAPPKIYDIYVSLYLKNNTQESLSAELNYTPEYVQMLNKKS